mmetsp:Transcript_11687/g.29171  ORF Transcript_11687/g.29171 Transcript_11687/m.29171 type:complete len:129 (+) Transcript_11687:83-469(+)
MIRSDVEERKRTTWTEKHIQEVYATLEEGELAAADTDDKRRALAAKVLERLPDGTVKKQLNTERLARLLKPMHTEQLSIDATDGMPDLYANALTFPDGIVAKILAERNIQIPRAYVLLAKKRGWGIYK